MQHRLGPNRAGPFGLLQPLADGVKLALKEDIIPQGRGQGWSSSSRRSSPRRPAFVSFAVIPFGAEVSIFGHRTPLQLDRLAGGGAARAGHRARSASTASCWPAGPPARRTRCSAALRSARPDDLLRDRDGPVLRGRVPRRRLDVDLRDRRRPGHGWYAWVLAPSFLIYLIAMVGETNRLPFDLPEAEGELVGGFHTEYSSLKFALFFLAEYINMATVSALATTLFLGGWRAPWPIVAVGGREQRLVAGALVPRQGLPAALRASSGCAARCRGCATTSSWRSAGRC